MKKVVLALAFCALASAAQAQQGPYTPNMTCNQARQIVFATGAIVLSTGTHTYDRYVRDRRFCQVNEYLRPSFVPTVDTPQCPVGYTCVTDAPYFPFGD